MAYVLGMVRSIAQASSRYKVTLASLQPVAVEARWADDRRVVEHMQVDEAKGQVGRLMASSAMRIVDALNTAAEGLSDEFADARDSEDNEALSRAFEHTQSVLGMHEQAMKLFGDPFLQIRTEGDSPSQVAGAAGDLIAVPPDAREAAEGLTQVAVRILLADFTTTQKRAHEAEEQPQVVDVTPKPAPPGAPPTAPMAPPSSAPKETQNGPPRQLFVE